MNCDKCGHPLPKHHPACALAGCNCTGPSKKAAAKPASKPAAKKTTAKATAKKK